MSVCTKDIVCKESRQTGHKRGDAVCGFVQNTKEITGDK